MFINPNPSVHSLPSQSVRTDCVILDSSSAMTSVITLETGVQSVSALCSALGVGAAFCLLLSCMEVQCLKQTADWPGSAAGPRSGHNLTNVDHNEGIDKVLHFPVREDKNVIVQLHRR